MQENETLEAVPCFICGETADTEKIIERGKGGLPTHVSICPHDGLVYLNPRWTKARYQQFYAHDYYRYYRSAKPAALSDEEKYRHPRAVWRRSQPHLGKARPEVVLDIGAGMGWSLDYVRKEISPGARLAAIEPSADCRAHLTEALGATVVTDDADTNWQEGREGAFDFVIMRHVLEHLLDPVAALRKVRHVLAPGGRAYVAVPDMMSPIRPLAERWFEVVHTYYFGEVTLARAAARAGLRPLVLQPEGSEVWAVFERAPEGYAPEFPSVYEEQMRLIQRHKRIDRAKKAAYFLPRALARQLPASVAGRMPAALRQRLL